jgi:hypothetical protein
MTKVEPSAVMSAAGSMRFRIRLPELHFTEPTEVGAPLAHWQVAGLPYVLRLIVARLRSQKRGAYDRPDPGWAISYQCYL